MKTILLSAIIFLSINTLRGQQFIENIHFDSTLMNGAHINSVYCTQSTSTLIQLDTSLFNYVNGLQFIIIIDSVDFSGPMSSSPVHPGDTIILNSSDPIFAVSSLYSGSFWFRIKLEGTPNTPNQNYPCSIETMLCTCFCNEILIRKSDIDTSICNVNLYNDIYESDKNNSLKVYPNPAINKFTILGIDEKSTIQLVDKLGNRILKKETNNNFEIDTSNLPNGIYSLIIFNKINGFTSQKIILQNNK